VSSEYILGAKDGIKRELARIARSPEHDCDDGYTPALLELEPGRWFVQIIELARIKRGSEQ
jgi:hypothetical protein